MLGKKIRMVRLEREYSQAYMGFCLDITQKAYSKLENNQSKLTVQRLVEIAEILDTPVTNFFEEQTTLNELPKGIIQNLRY